ncbi:MAG: tRNA lysidine(34) synthetase TilS [Bacteroidota bacterium]
MVQTKFLQFLQQYHLPGPNDKWLVAVSGGVDSVVLCHLCSAYNVPYAMAHCNFQLRGEESERDKSFVISLAKEFGVELFVKDFDIKQYMTETGTSVQVAARELRYNWFYELLAQSPIPNPQSLIATAHHANDNIETVLMHLFRGTGIRGMRGIQPVQGKIIRPLLQITKEQILEYASTNELTWVEDSSNSSDKYTRNMIRNNVLPMMEQAIPRDEMGYEKTIEMMTEAEALYDEAIALHKKKLLEVKGNEVHIPVLKLAMSKPLKTITYEIIKDFGFSSAQTEEVLMLLQSESGKYVASASYRIIRNRAWLIIAPNQSEAANHILIEKGKNIIPFADGKLNVQYSTNNAQFLISKEANAAVLDVAGITFPLILRPWKQGDYFYPLGMTKKKKLARFFIDQKLSKTDKENIWVIESNKKILWIVGHRIDDRFKITGGTKEILRLHLTRNN